MPKPPPPPPALTPGPPHLRTAAALWAALALALALAGCGDDRAPGAGGAGPDTLMERVAGEGRASELPSFRQLLGRDDIPPVYEPSFVPASRSGLGRDELVIGVAVGGEARAYPVRYLRWREMVNDEVGGVPILVSW